MTPQQIARLSTLLDEVWDLDEAQRVQWLDGLTGDDRALAPTLKELLARRAQPDHGPPGSAAAALDASAALGALGVSAASPGSAHTLAEGSRVGPYRLLRLLGEGGMGEVWLAERADGALKRQVALKLPALGHRQAVLLRRFDRERDILAALEHPHIARLYDAGAADDGRPYLALEFVEGEPIDHWCRQRGASVAERAALLAQVAEAVAYAHSRLVVHRDLKPGNILVTAGGQVRLLDFGVAKLLEGEPGDDAAAPATELTRIGGRAMTLAYASPEQIRGDAIGTASDIYSLGVVAFELLSGQRPYRIERGAVAPEQQVLDAQVPALSRAATEPALARQLQGDLEAIVAQALRKPPAERYTTADALARDLRAYGQGRPVAARGDTAAYRLRRWLVRERVPVAVGVAAAALFALALGVGAAVLLAVVLAVGLGVALWQAQRTRRERDRAWRMVRRADAVQSFLNTLITDVARGGQPLDAAQLLVRAEQLAAREAAGQDPEVLAMVMSMVGSSMQTLGNSAESIRLGERALELARGSDDIDLLDALRLHHALAVGWSGRYVQAKQTLRAIAERPGVQVDRRAEAHHYLASLANANNDAEAALKHAEEALRCHAGMRSPNRGLEASMLMSLGMACSLAGRMAEAERHLAAAFERFKALGQDKSPRGVTLLNNWSVLNERAGDARRALELAEQALAAAGTDGRSPFLLLNRARALEHLGRFDDADGGYAEAAALAAARRMAPPQVGAWLGRASIALHQGRLDAAGAALAEARAAGLDGLPALHPQRVQQALVLGRLALMQGDATAATGHFRAALEAGPQQGTAVAAGIGLADAAVAAGDAAAAVAHARQALASAELLQAGKPHSVRTALASAALARALAAAGELASARRQAGQAREALQATVDPGHPLLGAMQVPGGEPR